MRFRMWRAAVAATAISAALMLSGCVTEGPEPKPTPSTSATPLFATDEEALAAAEEAYAAYLAAIDRSLQTGGEDVSELSKVAVGSALSSAQADAEEFSAARLKTTGSTGINNIRLQVAEINYSKSAATIRLYVCEDVSAVDLVDANGLSVVSPERKALTPFEVEIEYATGDGKWLVSERSLWDGAPVCV